MKAKRVSTLVTSGVKNQKQTSVNQPARSKRFAAALAEEALDDEEDHRQHEKAHDDVEEGGARFHGR